MDNEEKIYIESKKISLNFIKKEPFIGSYKGMRYQLINDKENDVLLAIIWPEPFCLDKTPDEQKKKQSFPLTSEGKEQAVLWLNIQYQKNFLNKTIL